MNIQEENSARYFRVQSEREQTLVTEKPFTSKLLVNDVGMAKRFYKKYGNKG